MKIYESNILRALKRQSMEKSSKKRQTPVKKRKELLIMTIDIGGGVEEEITVFEGDDPRQIAMAVAKKHSLEKEIAVIIEENIVKNLITVKAGQIHSYENIKPSTGQKS